MPVRVLVGIAVSEVEVVSPIQHLRGKKNVSPPISRQWCPTGQSPQPIHQVQRLIALFIRGAGPCTPHTESGAEQSHGNAHAAAAAAVQGPGNGLIVAHDQHDSCRVSEVKSGQTKGAALSAFGPVALPKAGCVLRSHPGDQN